MTSSQVPGLHLGDYDWHQRRISPESLNRPAIEVWGEELDGTPLEVFLRIPDGSPREYYQAREIEFICPLQTLRELRQGAGQSLHEPVAWLDDRAQTGQPRMAASWLTQASLYEALRAERRVNNDDTEASSETYADRRLIFIPNPDCRSLWPLIYTAPCQQASVLGEFLWKHVTADWSIQVSFSDDGRSYSLAFHLPFYVWSPAKTLLQDKRIRPDKTPLRKSTPVSFLNNPGKATSKDDKLDFLHEAQWSCVVTGYSNVVWTGYGLTDTYFYDADSPFDRSSIRYFETCFQEEGICLDPISGFDANLPIQNPREYFLITLRKCADHIKEEWVHTIARLERKMENYIQDRDVFFGHTISSLGAADDRSKFLQESYVWTRQVSRLLTSLTERINNTARAWESFKARDFYYFHDIPQKGRQPRHLLHSIDATFIDLQSLQVRLGNLTNKHEDSRKLLELYLQVENNRTIVLQQYNINFIQIISPPALTAAMMQSSVLPWKSGFLPWVVITAVLWILTASVRPALTWYHRCLGSNPRPTFISHFTHDSMMDSFGYIPDGVALPQPTFARYQRRRFENGMS
ncbi:hypothetical protein NM208_g326 [Fusarium decemcellulare]|uniref:Uncharacterized protein n=1 Tax=Fusarium decemcellulare TaxID=57161 RepID=A0ACC1T038_9HYPO|nr:hypothetical protein NM208_g326 [Fusarium decemcellulare]